MDRQIFRKIVDIFLLVIPFVADALFLYSLLKNIPIMQFIMGIVVIILLFVSFFKPLINKSPIRWYDWIEIIYSFVFAVVLLSAYLYAIQDKQMREVCVPIVSTILGGLITMFGVGITIKVTRKDKEDEYLRIYKPNFTIFKPDPIQTSFSPKFETSIIELDNASKSILRNLDGKGTFKLDRISISNSDFTIFTLVGVRFNNFLNINFKPLIINKGTNIICKIKNLHIKTDRTIKQIDLCINDAMNNLYYMPLEYIISEHNVICVSGFGEMKLIKQKIER